MNKKIDIMKNKIKEFFLKKEVEAFKKAMLELAKGDEELERRKKELEQEEREQEKRENNLKNEETELYIKTKKEFEEEFLKIMKEKIGKLDKIKEYNLYPGKKLWSYKPFDEGICKIEIKRITFEKEN